MNTKLRTFDGFSDDETQRLRRAVSQAQLMLNGYERLKEMTNTLNSVMKARSLELIADGNSQPLSDNEVGKALTTGLSEQRDELVENLRSTLNTLWQDEVPAPSDPDVLESVEYREPVVDDKTPDYQVPF